MNGQPIDEVKSEKDLGVTVSNDVKASKTLFSIATCATYTTTCSVNAPRDLQQVQHAKLKICRLWTPKSSGNNVAD